MSIGEIIYTNRKKAGISQEELADMLGVSRQSVSLWETDQTAPSTANLVRLTEIFNISMDELCGKEIETDTPSPSTSDGNNIESDCLAQVQTVYGRALLKKVHDISLKKSRVLSIVTIVLSVFLAISIILSPTSKDIIALPIFLILIAATMLITLSVRSKKRIEEELKLRPNGKITVLFYRDRFDIDYTADNSTAKYTKHYSEVTRVQKGDDILLIYVNSMIVPIHISDLKENADAIFGLLRISPSTNSSGDKRIRRLLLAMFILSIVSIWLALISCAITLESSPLPEFSVAMVEYMWLFYVFIPIPVASAILGAVFLKKKYKCKKNIVVGIIMTALLAIFGSMASMTDIEVKHDFEYVRSIESELPIELPKSGNISYTLNSSDLIKAEVMVKPSDKTKTIQSIKCDSWLSKNEFYQSNMLPSGIYLATRQYDYFYLYDLDCKKANSQISGEHNGHNFVYLAYLQDDNLMQIIRFQSDGNNK